MKEQQNRVVQTAQDLIRIPSYSGDEQQVLSHIEGFFSTKRIESFRQGGNLVVHMKGKDQTRAFMFNAHVDVVDAGDPSKWRHEPWSGDVEDGRLYGRGASDMKSGVAASMETATVLADQVREGKQLPCDAWFVFVEKEEVDGSGTQSFANWFQENGYTNQYNDIAVVFAEPTSLETIEYGHRGNFFMIASLDGDTGHSSRPRQIETHAIMEMQGFIHDLQLESKRWHKKFAGGEFAPPTITPTTFEAHSDSPNKVAEHAEAKFDLRTIPGFHEKAFERVATLAARRGITLSLEYPAAPTGYTPKDATLIKLLQELVPDVQLEVSEGSADLGFMTTIGAEGVIFGPGIQEQSHTTNEYAPIDHLPKAITLFTDLYYRWGNKPKA